jgi:uncharacterized protein with PIN domain
MRVIDHDTGKHYHLEVTEELEADLNAHQQSHCVHPETEIRQRRNRGGALQLYRQCVTCGASVGSAIKRSVDLSDSPPWKDGYEEQYNSVRKVAYDAIIQKHVRKQKSGDEGFQRQYDLYLSSPEWQARRAKVLKRANGICEGCLDRKATQVHHLTYRHIFAEFMFELLAVCNECHARLHEDKDGDSTAEIEADLRSEWEDHYPCDGCRHAGEQRNRRWCFILDQFAADALLPEGGCGPQQENFEPLK